jgi:hypothetical protein
MRIPVPQRRLLFSSTVSRLCLFLLIAVFVTPFSVYAAGDDDYLEAIEMETEKVERKVVDGEGDGSRFNGSRDSVDPRIGGGKGFSSGLSIEEFEAELSEKYTGGAVFYKKLPRRNQEEVYQEYAEGASYDQVRKKIMDRYLGR